MKPRNSRVFAPVWRNVPQGGEVTPVRDRSKELGQTCAKAEKWEIEHKKTREIRRNDDQTQGRRLEISTLICVQVKGAWSYAPPTPDHNSPQRGL